MRKICILLFSVCCFAPAGAYFDSELYPFADVCGPDMEEYCGDVAAIGDCMVDNYSMLDSDCGDAIFYWAGGHWGWRDPHIRDNWSGMSARERHDYAVAHRAEFDNFKNARAAKPNVSRDMEFNQFRGAVHAPDREIRDYHNFMETGPRGGFGGFHGGGMRR
ncbi:MAG: hypothetical protein LBK26_03835 [Rickettsiales bacterium]|jgi:hypothetical protein|nr:hypothetical protein [Rickettsiales bacterium]